MIELDKLRKLTIAENPFCALLQMELLDAKEGYALGRLPIRNEIMNMYGSVHGGASYALADTIGGIAATTYGYYVVTVDGKMNYLLQIKDTQYLYCEAKAVRQGKTIGFYRITFTNDTHDIVATADFTYYRLDKKLFYNDTNNA